MPTLTKNFADIISFARATQGWRINSAGQLVPESAGVPRIDYDPVTLAPRGLMIETEPRTNLLTNTGNTGAALGVIGSGGSLPTGWSATPVGISGVNVEVAGIGSESGLAYVDVRLYGTAIGTYAAIVVGSVPSGISSANQYSGSLFLRRIAGGVDSIPLRNLILRPSGGADISAALSSGAFEAAALVGNRRTVSGTPSGALTGVGQLILLFMWSAGYVCDVTLRLAFPQVEQGGTASSPIAASGAQVTRAADVATIQLPYACDLLVQDRSGAEWRNGLSAGAYSLSPRTGFNYVSRVRAYPAGSLDSATKATMAVAA